MPHHTSPEALAARLDVLGAAVAAIARALPPDQAAFAGVLLRASVADSLDSRRSLGITTDEATASELAPLLEAFGR